MGLGTSAGPGRRLAHYQIRGELGRGAMGVVYRAFDERLRREVALKTVSGLADAEDQKRIVLEARAVAQLRHPGIVAVHDAGVVNGVCFVAFELVPGGTLAARLAEKGPYPANDAAVLVAQLARAVQAAHEAGIVHRDLKPSNVLLDERGRPRLADFGLALDEKRTAITATGVTLGTPAYMAPEQADPKVKTIGPWTDVYGLGAVLYHVLAGSPPFRGPTPLAVVSLLLTEDVESPSVRRAARGLPAVARDLENVCLKAIEKRPESRYESAVALAEDLERFARGEPVLARPVSTLARAGRWTRRRPLVAALVALSLFASVAAVALAARARDLAEERARSEFERDVKEAAQRSAARDAKAHAIERARGDVVAAVGSLEEVFASLSETVIESPKLRAPLVLVALDAMLRARRLEEIDSVDGATFSLRIHGRVADALISIREFTAACASLEHAHSLALGQADEEARASVEQSIARLKKLSRTFAKVETAGTLARFEQSGSYDRALTTCNEALELEPDFVPALVERAHIHNDQSFDDERAGSAARVRKELRSAMADLDRAVQLEPQNARARAERALLWLRVSEIPPALADAELAVARDPRDHKALYARGLARLETGQRTAGLQDLEGVLALAPDSIEAVYARSKLNPDE